jgi:hypothetical protein
MPCLQLVFRTTACKRVQLVQALSMQALAVIHAVHIDSISCAVSTNRALLLVDPALNSAGIISKCTGSLSTTRLKALSTQNVDGA